jgi:thioredoxin 1
MVTVQTHREVSNAVAARLGVRHETPQALIVRGGRVVWSASHFRVTAKAVDAALRGVER